MNGKVPGEFPGFVTIAPQMLRDNEGVTVRDTYPNVRDNECLNVHARQCQETGQNGGGYRRYPPHVPFTQPVSRSDVPVKMSRQQRLQSFAAWVNAGRPWPPPVGLVSSCLTPLVRARREKW
jgi:hypothetical protein